ncbi:hypothetical protein FA10DRAFT_269880 [Acaromyces ingoldii]|uniref:Coenzyme Q-binding protein COQ10 START domain-containing protein n=1 Tax=Acaromyces ingoldii TaxID=215250 RepID=A0A316YAX3_9BASI|nr:hypothetical protein FA10DRAFT_269880 [Acaromyces ingoldii]PWN86776.1 hypothetical protein FA10DRAFT_269880 [Acaromyces ingoldii]
MRFSHETTLDSYSESFNLADWLFTLSEEEYHACQAGHRAIGVVGKREGMVNVESIGGSLIIQHYRTVVAERDRVLMKSPHSRAYLLHLIPAPVGVAWEMEIIQKGQTRTFRCTIDIQLPLLLRLLSSMIATPFFIRRHLVQETDGFAQDMSTKMSK